MTTLPNHYSATRVRTALMHFASGKVFGLITGLGWILCIVRILPKADYGAYIAFVAFLGISIVISSFGLIAIAERYVPDIRTNGTGNGLARLLTQLMLARTCTLIVASAGVTALSGPITRMIGLPQAADTFQLFQIVVFSEGLCRYSESIFDSLLKQKYSQISLLFRNSLRLAALIVFSALANGTLTLHSWVIIESTTTSVGLFISLLLFHRTTCGLRQEFSNNTHQPLPLSRLLHYTVPAYASHTIVLFSGPELALLLTSRILGIEVTAMFGFCMSLAQTAQRYLPSFLLVGMVRPLFIAAVHHEFREARINFLFSLLIKLNVLMILPMIVLAIPLGDNIVNVLSNAKFPHSGSLLLATLLYILSTALRISQGMIVIALEDGRGVLYASLLASLSFFCSITLVGFFGTYALLLGLILGNVLAVAVTRTRINQRSLHVRYPLAGLGKMALVALASCLIGFLGKEFVGGTQLPNLVVVISASLFAYALLLKLTNSFSIQERNAINSVLPKPLFVW